MSISLARTTTGEKCRSRGPHPQAAARLMSPCVALVHERMPLNSYSANINPSHAFGDPLSKPQGARGRWAQQKPDEVCLGVPFFFPYSRPHVSYLGLEHWRGVQR